MPVMTHQWPGRKPTTSVVNNGRKSLMDTHKNYLFLLLPSSEALTQNGTSFFRITMRLITMAQTQ